MTPVPYTAHGVIVGIGGGNAEIAYDENPGTGTQVFLEAVNYQQLAEAPTAIATTQTSGTTSGASITIPDGTVGEYDKATITGANAGSATGTLDYGLYSSSSCAASSLLLSSTSTVTGGVAGPSPVLPSRSSRGPTTGRRLIAVTRPTPPARAPAAQRC